MNFQRLFNESKGQPILYKYKWIFLSDKMDVLGKIVKVEYEILNTNSEWIQGIMFKGVGVFEVNGSKNKMKTLRDGIVFWENTAPQKLAFLFQPKEMELHIYNVWKRSEKSYTDAWTNGAAMYKELLDNKIIYHCNDGHPNDDFSDLTFSIKIEIVDSITDW